MITPREPSGPTMYTPDRMNDITRAINGQYTAIACYEQLIRQAPSEAEKQQIMEIREDEIRHYQTFCRLYSELTGRNPAPQITAPCPSQYIAGLHAAFKDEQETVDFYHGIADRAAAPYIRDPFRRAAFDEQNHAVWFLYFLSQQHAF